jgi:hypothetical protein
VLGHASYLDTTYNGVEITANKRLCTRWQMLAGLTIGKNTGGVNAGGTSFGQTVSAAADGV